MRTPTTHSLSINHTWIWEHLMAAFTQTENGIAMATIANSNGPAEVVAFHHAAVFSPALSTLQKAMKKGYLPPLPELTAHTLEKFPPPQEATTMGHLDNRRKNIKSTKQDINQNSTNYTQPNQTIRIEHTRVILPERKQDKLDAPTKQDRFRYPLPVARAIITSLLFMSMSTITYSCDQLKLDPLQP
jgi:hypothetical protein